MAEWKPIESAPRDGTAILAFCAEVHSPCDIIAAIYWRWDQWFFWGPESEAVSWHEPTHWMPLPPPPEEWVEIPRLD